MSVDEPLTYLFDSHAKINDQLMKANKEIYAEMPDLSKLIGVHFRKQEQCQKIAVDGGVPISEAHIVLQLQLHIVKTCMEENI